MTNYQNGLIYKWVCDDCDEVYVGSTTNFTRRKYSHKTNCNNEKDKNHNLKIYKTMRQYGGFHNWRMIQIETYPCESKRELEAREEDVRKELNAKLNAKRAFLTKEEYKVDKAKWDKKYREEHKEEIKEKRLDYFDEYNNKEEVKDRKHDWYLANKEKSMASCKERRKEKTECEVCGIVYTACRKSEHIKTDKHLWSVENNQKYSNHVPFRTKEITCECGSVCFGKNLGDHLKSKKHQNYINSQNK